MFQEVPLRLFSLLPLNVWASLCTTIYEQSDTEALSIFISESGHKSVFAENMILKGRSLWAGSVTSQSWSIIQHTQAWTYILTLRILIQSGILQWGSRRFDFWGFFWGGRGSNISCNLKNYKWKYSLYILKHLWMGYLRIQNRKENVHYPHYLFLFFPHVIHAVSNS